MGLNKNAGQALKGRNLLPLQGLGAISIYIPDAMHRAILLRFFRAYPNLLKPI